MLALRHAPLLPFLFLALPACQEYASQAECEAMLEHGVELSIRDKHPDAKPTLVASEKERRRRQPPGRQAIESCTQEVSKKALACAMQASHIDDYERCLVIAPWGFR